VVLDPFGGAGTVSLVAERLGRDSIYIDLNPEYVAMARKRIVGDCPMFTEIGT
jgi:DNA modification methylase